MKSFFAEVEVKTSDGETLKLVCNFFAIDFIERLTGQSIQHILPQLDADGQQSLVVKVLLGLLRHRHEEMDIDTAAAIAFGPDKGKVALAMGEAISRAFTFEEAKDKNPPERRGRSRSTAENG